MVESKIMKSKMDIKGLFRQKKMDFTISHGKPQPYGATIVNGGINFSIGSTTAEGCTLVLFKRGETLPFAEIEIPEECRFGNIFAVKVHGLDPTELEYGYRFTGPENSKDPHRFDPSMVILDPYAKAVSGRQHWRETPDWQRPGLYRGLVVPTEYDWGTTTPPKIHFGKSIIYEAHVRGMTASKTAKVNNPGTFDGLREKIPYLKNLGITAIELLPIFEFDEHDGSQGDINSPDYKVNYWGYNTVNFFSPKLGYSADKTHGGQATDLKRFIHDCHQNDIEVILDVVFNHTAEGDQRGNTFSFRGVDDRIYYMLTPEGYYYNFSGCGNTLNANHPVVREMIIDSLVHWVTDYRIDGFRFDLASILDRDEFGAPMATPPLLSALTHLPVFAKTKLIAEAWDAGGLYQVGHFPSFGKFAEWNGKFRDCARKFLKGEPNQVGELALRLAGSPDLYSEGQSHLGINFITCHDGFTLNDLVSYNTKHNESNGNNNTDGADDNDSWNHGVEGPTTDLEINSLRLRQMKNAFMLLMTSVGVPMVTMGDEIARTQFGNNNVYCQDNEMSWMDWTLLEKNAELHRFLKLLIKIRKTQVALEKSHPRRDDHVTSFHGTKPWAADYSSESRFLAMMVDETRIGAGTDTDIVYVAFNTYWEGLEVELPGLPEGRTWYIAANTGVSKPNDISELGSEPILENQKFIFVGPRSSILLLGKSHNIT